MFQMFNGESDSGLVLDKGQSSNLRSETSGDLVRKFSGDVSSDAAMSAASVTVTTFIAFVASLAALRR
jgi:hypothetical protein